MTTPTEAPVRPTPTHPLLRRVAAPIALTAALLATGATGASAATAPSAPRGTTSFALDGPAAKQLRRVATVAPRRPATGGTTLRLPVRSGSVTADQGIVDHEGRIVLRAGRRTLTLSGLRVTIRNGSTISAVVRGRRLRLFVVATTGRQRTLRPTAGTVGLTRSRVTLTAAGARILRRELRLERLRPGRFGTIAVDAALGALSPPPSLPAGSALTPTAGARPVVAGTLTWRQRTSWMQYVESGRGSDPVGGTTVITPAVAGPVESLAIDGRDPIALPYSHAYPLASGWYDPALGVGAIRFAGGLRHRFASHLIDYTASDPEVVLDGGGSQLVATLKGAPGATTSFDARGRYMTLDPAAAQRTVSGDQVTLTGIPATVPASGSGAFQGFYTDGDPFGSIDRLQLTLGG
ncbi:HtaA domain-containing protein [Patulibacter medicamentivorans]|uniref:HtaA domain-containing protein n=1 Tax=Patulibacter medicamentivorans TaxID=1097667 RepID=UPI0011104250|nr:HtaA domain-containing protein [Patulibacter medicamentivorans]